MNNDNRNEGIWEAINNNRDYMKCPDFSRIMHKSDQEKQMTQPPLSKSSDKDVIILSDEINPAMLNDIITSGSYIDLLDNRRSERVYDKDAAMSKDQLAFILWSTQGIQDIKGSSYATLRPVPSGGARHPFETYFIARNVEGLKPGLYHYLPLENIGKKCVAVEFINEFPDYNERITEMLAGQKWAVNAPVIVFYSCVAYRAEWRYSSAAHRVVLIDLGHVGQNFMLSAAAMGLGSCCMAAYNQKLCDEALQLDGYEEYTVYACSIGKIK